MFNPFQPRPPVNEITAEDVKKIIDQNEDVLLLDVRTHQEYSGEMGHIQNSMLIPLQMLWHHSEDLEKYKNKQIIIYCRSGQRSAEACRILDQQGFKTKNMLGGMIRWNQLQYKVEY